MLAAGPRCVWWDLGVRARSDAGGGGQEGFLILVR